MERIKVESKNIASVGYMQSAQILEIEFGNGRVYQYYGVPAGVHDNMMRADSIGSFFAREVKNSFTAKEITD